MYQSILDFWFKELEPKDWWVKSAELDATIKTRFGDLLMQASNNELYIWRTHAQGALAEVILLDQFSRNIYRNDPRAFQNDTLAQAIAIMAVNQGFDQQSEANQRSFFYMPYMHSESPIIHEQAVRLFTDLATAQGNDSTLNFEYKHKVIIDRFGRYPHRNAILGRKSTQEEFAFLQEPGSSF